MKSLSLFKFIYPTRGLSSFKSMLTRQDLINYTAKNEPILQFKTGSSERAELLKTLNKYKDATVSVPIVIGDEEYFNVGEDKFQLCPHNHSHKVAKFSYATRDLLEKAIVQSIKARREWEARPIEERAAIFLKAADLCAGKYRSELVASTMIGQSKTVIQAEIDASVEFIDFLRFNVSFLGDLLKYSPVSTNISTNSLDLRGTEGFWAAVSPFNFTSIGGNLASAPVLMGNVSLWKPSDTAVLSNYITFKALREAGVPANVIQFVPADGPTFGSAITSSPHLAGINFTGSVPTFRWLWTQVGQNLEKYRTLPRLIGELGGKNFHFVHPSADVQSVVNGTVLSSFEYSGQKCSACSRMYAPASLWPQIKSGLQNELKNVKVGSPIEFDSFFTAVIDKRAFDRVMGYIDFAKKNSSECTVVFGGSGDDSKGYFVQPTVIETTNPRNRLMTEEIFGPVLTVYVYDDAKIDETLSLIDSSTPYGLTGAIFCRDKAALSQVRRALRDSAGNLYINDKSTGAVVGQQPFGGSRWSGTNDKAGGPHYLLRFVSGQAIKETHVPLTTWKYPYMSE